MRLRKYVSVEAKVWIDLDGGGPDRLISGGTGESDWRLCRTSGWRTYGEPLRCDAYMAKVRSSGHPHFARNTGYHRMTPWVAQFQYEVS